MYSSLVQIFGGAPDWWPKYRYSRQAIHVLFLTRFFAFWTHKSDENNNDRTFRHRR